MDTWFRSYRTSPWAGVIPNHLYFPTMREMLAGLVARGAKLTAAAVGTEAGERVLGWVCHEDKGADTVLHFVYVKDPFRRQGLGKALVDYVIGSGEGRLLYTHRTRLSKYVLPKDAAFVPEVARRKAL